MKLYLEVNGTNYYLAQAHKRQALKLYDNAYLAIEAILTNKHLKFRNNQVQMNDVKAILITSSKVRIKLSLNNNDYDNPAQECTLKEQSLDEQIKTLVEQAINDA